MDDNDQCVILNNAIRALENMHLAGFGSDMNRKLRLNDAMHNVLLIIEQVRQAQKTNIQAQISD